MIVNQYGRPRRANWGPDTIEGTLTEEELSAKCHDQNVDNVNNRFLDEDYYASRDYQLSDIEVPLLSVGNWGGILLHLRGNVEGFMQAGSQHKYLRLITGRHDLPFYTKECVDLQRSFLDAFLKGVDTEGWGRGAPPRVAYKLRLGDVGYNDAAAESAYPTQLAADWPIPETKYVRHYLASSGGLDPARTDTAQDAPTKLSYKALGNLKAPQLVSFVSPAFDSDTEFTGHIVAHLNVSVTSEPGSKTSHSPSDTDLFLSVRHLDANGKEILYTGTVGDPVPVSKGWLRCSLRAVNTSDPLHQGWRPYREYQSQDHSSLEPGRVYEVDVEIWPTNVVIQAGEKLVLEVSSGDTQGAGLFEHNSDVDRDRATFGGINHIHFGDGRENWLMMPMIPKAEKQMA